MGSRFRALTIPALCLAAAAMLLSASALRCATLTVTTVNDAVNAADGCSLREAVTAVKNQADFSDCVHTGSAYGTSDTIAFAISGAGVHTITLGSTLPDITKPVLLDGYSQTGASANTLATGDNANILIRIDGSSAAGIFNLATGSFGSTLQGLSIVQTTGGAMVTVNSGNATIAGNFIGVDPDGVTLHGFNTPIQVSGGASNTHIGGTSPASRNLIAVSSAAFGVLNDSDGLTVQGNYFGTNAAGTAALGGQARGITVEAGSGTIIGGTTVGAGNVFGAWTETAIIVDSACLTCIINGATIQGNLIGTDVSGTVKLTAGVHGIAIGTSSNVQIGGNTAAAGNVISGAAGDGIVIAHSPVNASIQGNRIGTDITGTVAMGNGNCGINVFAFSSAGGNIGGSGAGNVIAFNATNGIGISGANTGWNISANSIHDNHNLGITLGGRCDDLSATPTLNDNGDPDTGPNNLQNYPVLDAPSLGTGTVTLSGSLNSAPISTFHVEFFANPICASRGNGQGKIFLGSTDVTTDASGNKTFGPLTFSSPSGNLVFTATARDAANSTSEFSACVRAMLLDIDDNGSYDALTDGLILIRYLLGLRDASLVDNAIGPGANRNTSAAVEAYLASVLPRFDIDGNGQVDVFDGLLALRYLFGLRDASLIDNAVGPGASRKTAMDIEQYLISITP